ncbi:chemotaxis protein CheD [Jannaschia seohaensis]|uniref:Chemotaxis protein CheD n=1 Tax=Jannaschia seohaensis TaxID=475081 RepID=A0A2Y9B5M2_9RHOB|nr:chemotaxis protein CheD [Jannaschia seohaensis]PWJ13784.1 chemotaxis protein CheD [Jannaschia seohaensis]SSA50297.1 chemotaxis protein CheD [Jannaschia seohaensis]
MTAQARAAYGGAPGTKLLEIGQGQMEVSADPAVEMTATLGSCISVCLWSPSAGCGGMNHIFRSVAPGPMGDAAVVAEVEKLVNALMRHGAKRSEMAARVVGGAHVLLRGRNHGMAIGEACMNYLSNEGFQIVGVSIGGERARRVRFHPVSGKLAVGLMADIHTPEDPAPPDKGNDVEMF